MILIFLTSHIQYQMLYQSTNLCSGGKHLNNSFACNPHMALDIMQPKLCSPDSSSHNSAAAAAKSLQSCPTLCDPTVGSPPGSSVPGILQARALEGVAISFSELH